MKSTNYETDLKQFSKRGTVTPIMNLSPSEKEIHLIEMSEHTDQVGIYLNGNSGRITRKERTMIYAIIKGNQSLIKELRKQIVKDNETVSGKRVNQFNYMA